MSGLGRQNAFASRAEAELLPAEPTGEDTIVVRKVEVARKVEAAFPTLAELWFMIRNLEMIRDLFAMARLSRALIVPAAFVVVSAGMATVILPCAGKAETSFDAGVHASAAAQQRGAIQVAQGYGLPPADVGDGGGGGGGDASGGGALEVVRIGRLEDQVRQLNGQIQQLQFANRQLQDQLRKFQQDVEFRFQELSGRRGKLPRHSELPDLGTTPPTMSADSGGTKSDGGDAFDPTKDPNAPGAPRVLGSLPAGGSASATPAADENAGGDDNTPINLLSSPAASSPPAPAAAPAPAAPALRPGTQAAVTPSGGPVIADKQLNQPQEQYDIALAYLKQKDYEDAERGFTAYLAKNPKGRHISDAIYFLGETYYLRGRQREAAEQYLKISAHYPNSPRAPEAMLRLGESLRALGAKEQACATFNEVPRKYPRASAAIKASAERAAKRAQC